MIAPFLNVGRVFDSVGDFELKRFPNGKGAGFQIAWNQATVIVFEYGVSRGLTAVRELPSPVPKPRHDPRACGSGIVTVVSASAPLPTTNSISTARRTGKQTL